MNKVYYSLRYLWELPQNIVGIAVYLLNRKRIINVKMINGRYLIKNNSFGISLGSYVFWVPSFNGVKSTVPNNLQHEYGHSVQSLLLGPLYLIIIGIPSISRVLYSKIFYSFKKQKWKNYYKGFPEKWADSLGVKYYKT